MIGKLETQDGKWYIRFDEKEVKIESTQEKQIQRYLPHLHGQEVNFDLVDWDGDIFALLDIDLIEWQKIFYDYRMSYRTHYLTLEEWLSQNYEYPITKR